MDIVGGAPLVIKLLEGTQGIGVVLAETQQAAKSVIEAFRGLDRQYSGAGVHQRSRRHGYPLLCDW